MRSSYKRNNYKDLFYALVKTHKPDLVVECGVLDGYSLIAFAKGVRDNEKKVKSKVIGIDLFDDYDYNHGVYEQVFNEACFEGVEHFIELRQKDVYEEYTMFEDESVDILHLDIANTPERIQNLLELWHDKVKTNGLILFEGGSFDRDNVEWVNKHCKNEYWEGKFNDWKFHLREVFCLEYVTLTPFPSLTICRKTEKFEKLDCDD